MPHIPEVHLGPLKKRAGFLKAARDGLRFVAPQFIVQFLWAPEASATHLSTDITLSIGYTASRRVGGAVVRNRAKRRMRSLVRDFFASPLLKEAGLQKGMGSVVIIARSEIVDAPYSELTKAFTRAMRVLIRKAQAPTPIKEGGDAC